MTNGDPGFSSKHWRARADEARAAADDMYERFAQKMMLKQAHAFDRLAEKAAEDEKSCPIPARGEPARGSLADYTGRNPHR